MTNAGHEEADLLSGILLGHDDGGSWSVLLKTASLLVQIRTRYQDESEVLMVRCWDDVGTMENERQATASSDTETRTTSIISTCG